MANLRRCPPPRWRAAARALLRHALDVLAMDRNHHPCRTSGPRRSSAPWLIISVLGGTVLAVFDRAVAVTFRVPIKATRPRCPASQRPTTELQVRPRRTQCGHDASHVAGLQTGGAWHKTRRPFAVKGCPAYARAHRDRGGRLTVQQTSLWISIEVLQVTGQPGSLWST